MKINSKHRVLSIILSVLMALSLMPATVFAADEAGHITVNGNEYGTYDAAVAAAVPENGIITYTVSGKVAVTSTDAWIEVLSAGLENVTAVKFVGGGDGAELSIENPTSVLADQEYDIDVSFEKLTLSHPNGAWVADLGHATNYFACLLRNVGASENTVTYTDCVFSNGVCNNFYGKTVFESCSFNNAASGKYNLWNYGGSTDVKNSTFTGTRGIKTYNEGTLEVAPDVTIENTAFTGLTEKPAIVSSKATDVTFNSVTVTDCAKGMLTRDISGNDEVTISANGSNISGTFNITGDAAAANVKDEFNISGGTFTSEVSSDYLADGFGIEESVDPDGNKTYGVAAKDYGYIVDEGGNITITSADGLFWFAEQANAGNNFAGKTVKLANDIDLNDKLWTPIGIYNDSKTHFKGTFDGQGHTVSGVNVVESRKNGVGFFGKVYTGTIKNLTVAGNITTDNCNYVGGIVGHGYATVVDCVFRGNVGSANTMQVGGIAGSGGFTVTRCSVYGNVTAECWAGGIVGNCQDGGSYTDCYVEGEINAERTYWGGGAAGITPVPLYPSQVITGCYSNTVVKVAGKEVNCPIIATYNNPLDYNGYTGGLKIYDNSWNKQKNPNDSYPLYAEKDGVGGVLVEGGDVARDNNLVMLDDDLNYVDDLSKVRIMSGSSVTQGQVDALAVAKVGEIAYTSLDAAFEAAKDGDTVTLLADITEDVVINKNITFDLGGKTITNTGAGKATLTVASGATATVKNGSIVGGASYYNIQNNGTAILEGITATAGNTGSSMIDNRGTLTINSGVYSGGLDTVKNEPDAKLTINGGSFTLNYGTSSGYNAVVFNYGTLKITGGTFVQSYTAGATYIHPQVIHTDKDAAGTVNPSTEITGGTFTNKRNGSADWAVRETNAAAGSTTVSGGSFNKKVTESYCAEGYIPTSTKDSNGMYGVKEGKYVAKIGSTKYETFEDAVKAASGKTITLLDDISLSSTVTVNKKVTIDLNQKTLTGTDNYILNIGANGNVTIMNGSINVSDSGSAITAYGTLALNDVDITGKATEYSLLYVNRNANVTIDKDTTITATDATSSAPYPTIFISGQDSDGNTYDPTLNIYGTVSAAKAPAIQGNGTDRGTSHINIYDGALIKSNKLAIYLPQICDVNITGGTVTGYCGIGIKSGTLNISGGTVQGVANDNVIGDQHSQTNGISYDGSAIMIDSYIGYAGNVTINISDNAKIESLHSTAIREIGNDNSQTNMVALNITGGEITGADGSDAVLVRETTAPTVAISGGTFTTAVPEDYCADGFIPTQNEDGTYGVKIGTYVAETNGVKYESLEEAINAATRGKTVTMLADTRENVTISKNLILDLNGFTINGGQVKGKATVMIDNARVTIMDSSAGQTGTIMREDTAENSGDSSYYVIDIQGKNGFLKFTGGNVKNGSGVVGVKGSSLVRLGDDNVRDANPTLTITGGTFTQDNFVAIKVDYGTLHLLGGVVNSANSYAVENWRAANIKGGTVNGTVSSWAYSTGVAYSTLTISGGTVNGNVASVNYDSAAGKQARIYVTGGTVTGTLGTYTYANGLVPTDETAMATIEVTAGTFEKDPIKYVVEGSAVKTNVDGTFGVEKAYLAKVGDTPYYTMDEAFHAALDSGKTLYLLRDYTTGTEQNSGSKNLTIDLGGHTWTYTGKDTNCAAFEINYSDVTLTVKNGTVISNSMVGLIPTAMSGSITYNNSALVFENVTMTANGRSGIETNGGNTNDNVTLINSTLNVPNGYGIYFPSSGTLTINNSVINAKTMGVQICAGSLNIIGDGTKITVTGDGIEKTENDGAIEDGAAISIVDRTGYKGLESIKIEAGTFVAKDGNDALKAYKWENKTESAFDNANNTVAVSGGTFSSAVKKEYCADGYKSVTDSNGNYTVKEANITVKVSSNISAAGTLTGGDMYAKGETVTVTATVNPGYVFLGWYDASGKLVNANTTYTFEAAESVGLIATFKGNKNVKLSVGLSGGIVTVSGDVTAKWRNDVKDNEFLLGTSFVLTAAPRAGYTFLYWINSEGRILSDEPEYKFTLGMDTSIKACFMETEQWEDSSYVIFRDNITKKIIWSGDVEMTAHSDGIYGTVAAPALLNYSGVTFKDWRDADGNVVTPDENGNIRITSNITIYAIYQATSDTFDVTVDGETVGSYGFRTSVSVTAPETKDGKYFAGWYRDGVLVSTNANYSFIIRSATALTTEYTDTKQEPASVAILTVGDREQKADGDVVAPFSLDWSLAEGCELVKVGIIRTYDASLKDKLTLENVNGSTIKTKESVLTTSDGNYQFNLTMGSTAAANDVYMTGYVMYRAANGNIITLYTDVVTSPAGN